MAKHTYPDLPEKASQCYGRASFRVDDLKFNKTAEDTYSNSASTPITVYCDQQDSTSWAARSGQICTGYYWAPEYAVAAFLDSLPKA